MLIEESEIKKICDKLKEHYIISNKPIKIRYKHTYFEYPQTVTKDENDIGGIEILGKDKKNIIDLNNIIKEEEIYLQGITIKEEEQEKGYGTNIIAILFCKIEKIKYHAVDCSDDFWKKIDPDYDPQKSEHELMREKFFKYNIEKIKKNLLLAQ